MMTVLTDIEAMINSRPLTYIGDDIRDGRIITPALLAVGRDLGSVPDNAPKKAELKLSDRYRYQQRLQNHFWSRWLREYLPSLTVRQKWTKEEIPLKEKDVVLISEDNVSRGKWRIGKVIETFPGRDGRVRTVKIATKKGMINRPVQRLHLLEEYRDGIQDERKTSAVAAVRTRETASADQKDAQPQLTDVQRSLKSRRGQRDSNDVPSLAGEDVKVTRYGRAIYPPKRL